MESVLNDGRSLFPHQETTLKWLFERENTDICGIKGGILSLKMGLGKTLSMLMLSALKEPEKSLMIKYGDKVEMKEISTPTLVIVSKSVIYEWKRSIESFFKPGVINYLVFYKPDMKYFDCITVDHV